ncbi:MAG: hypothetical protein J6B73_03090 [Methanobrevibacter sp.]|uniref:hypothetical protein n=1 Tax=Methanobrevibacter sp. TaxID=66852 RepID=UPI001AFD3FD6|nr:hypothetical protein [Methanobrevibacter sp.]MBO5151141.1 hypothetical protein [Methanobrevibacter sp.]
MDNNKLIIALVVILIVMIAAGIFLLNPGHAKVDSRVIVTSNSTLHDGDNFTIRLTDLNNTPISNQRVNITIIDANGGKNPQAVTTDANGDGRLQLNGLTLGNYTVNVTYGGNNNYTVCNTTQRLQMTEKVTPQASTTSTSSPNKNYDDGYWETSMDADFEYHTEYYSDGNFRQYDRSGRLVGSSYDADQYEVGSNVGFKI